MSTWHRTIAALVRANNQRIREGDPVTANPRPVGDLRWHQSLAAAAPTVRAEWKAFADASGRLPHIADVLGEDQGNVGPWLVGIITASGDPTLLGREHFPRTCELVAGIPRLQAALWSVLGAGTELTEHNGPNAGVLRYHLGVDCPPGAALSIDGSVISFTDGDGILFDDTVPHAGVEPCRSPSGDAVLRVERPLPLRLRIGNRLVQTLLAADPRRRRITALADEWHSALNPATAGRPGSQ